VLLITSYLKTKIKSAYYLLIKEVQELIINKIFDEVILI